MAAGCNKYILLCWGLTRLRLRLKRVEDIESGGVFGGGGKKGVKGEWGEGVRKDGI